MYFFHFVDMYLFVQESLLQNSVLFTLSVEFKDSKYLVLLLLDKISDSSSVFRRVQSGIVGLGRQLILVRLRFILVFGLSLGYVRQSHVRILNRFTIETLLSIGAFEFESLTLRLLSF